MKFAQDLWRALLVLVVATLLLERYCPPKPVGYSHPPSVATYTPPPTVQTYAPPPVPALQAQAPQVYIAPAQPERPLRRVAQSILDLGDSMIGVIR